MQGEGSAIRRKLKRNAKILVLLCTLCAASIPGSAQDQISPPKQPTPTQISPDLYVISDLVVEVQWKASLGLVNGPSDLKQIEPGQCIEIGVFATGDDRDQLLASAKIGFELSFADHAQGFPAEPPAAVKQAKPEGGDFVTQALGVAGVKNPMPSFASIAASQAKWCVPLDPQDGTATIRATILTADGKRLAANPRSIEVKTFGTARKNPPFKDINTFSEWSKRYHAAPDPAELLPGLRIVASDESARSMLDIMEFFVEALKASPAAAKDLLLALPNENRAVQIYSIPLLSDAGYATGPLLNRITEEERAVIESVRLPDPYDMTPDRTLPDRMDMLWSAFSATGRIEPVRAIALMLSWRPDYDKFVELQRSGQKPIELTESVMRGACYTAAGWSLSSFSREDGLAADYIDALRASPDTPAAVKDELANLWSNPAFRGN